VIENLRERWKAVWQHLNAQIVPQDVLEELRKAYSSATRFYHNLVHIKDCLSIFDETKFLAARVAEVELAIWFHDAVYDTRRSDNEQRSAEWARSVVLQAGVGGEVAERVSALILATRHDREVTDMDAQLMVDIDLSILGREPEVFWQYEENIRKEYAWVSERLFREKRKEILCGFLDREHIYYHETYREMFEEQARANLKQAVTRLSNVG
jgi:predicted metal-dependent HD superfamily phosphohydrolase